MPETVTNMAKYLMQPRISSQNCQSFLIGWKVSWCKLFQTHTVRSVFLLTGESRVQLLHCWSLVKNSRDKTPAPEMADGGLFQKAAGWAKSEHTLPLLCTASDSSLGPPWWHISPCQKAFFLWLSLGLDLPREIWLDLAEWRTLQQSYINLSELQSITLGKAASAIWIPEMEKKKFYRSLPVLKVILSWVVCCLSGQQSLYF